MGYKLGECDIEHQYRYLLKASIDNNSQKVLVVIQCNPSTATSSESDSTVGKVAFWAEENGFGEVVYLNLFAMISSQTSVLAGETYEAIVGPRNDSVLKENLNRDDSVVVLGWGGKIPIPEHNYKRRIREIKQLIESSGDIAHHVGALSYGTHPRHGLMWNKGYRDLYILDWAKIGA